MLNSSNEYPLISAKELAGNLSDSKVKIFDLRGKWGPPQEDFFEDYTKGHIPGAAYINWLNDFLEPGMPTNLASVASKAKAQADFTSLGIDPDDLVVLYDDYHHMLAGRIWWAMRYWGFTNVRVLDGGWKNWQAEGLPVSTDIPVLASGNFKVPEQPKQELRVDIDEVSNRSKQVYLLDARGVDWHPNRSTHLRRIGSTLNRLFCPQTG